MRPRGLLPTTPALFSASGSSDLDTTSTSLHRCSRKNSVSSPQPSGLSDCSEQPLCNGFARQRACSVEGGRGCDGGGGGEKILGRAQGEGEMRECGVSTQKLTLASSCQLPVGRTTRNLKRIDQENEHVLSGKNSPTVVGHLPLRENTNRQHLQQQQQLQLKKVTRHTGSLPALNTGNKPAALTGGKRSAAVSLLAPLNASRLNPMQQDTRSAQVTISTATIHYMITVDPNSVSSAQCGGKLQVGVNRICVFF